MCLSDCLSQVSHGSLRFLSILQDRMSLKCFALFSLKVSENDLKNEEFIIEGLATKLLFARVLVFVLTPTSDQVSVHCSV